MRKLTFLVVLLAGVGLAGTALVIFADECADAFNSKDYKRAQVICRKAAEQGDTYGQAYEQKILGWMYQKGLGVTQDHAEAVKWYRKAAEAGLAGAQFRLGEMYRQGWGVAQDYAEAVKWYRLAAHQRDERARYQLGEIYSQGLGVSQDYAEAVKWYRWAAEQRDERAPAKLGMLYAIGQGVTQDFVKAHALFNIAVAQGFSAGAKLRDMVAKEMTPADISKAQQLARECVEKDFKNCGF